MAANMLTDFCNIREFSDEAIGKLYRFWPIHHSLKGQEDGHERFVMSRIHPDTMFYFQEDADAREQRRKFGNDDFVSFPEARNHHQIFEALAKAQADYRAFLDKCAGGNLDLDFVNSRMDLMRKSNTGFVIKFQPGDDPWKPALWLYPTNTRTIEDYIDIYQIIFPLYRGDEYLSQIRNCKHCGKYFVAQTKRAVYCSDSCRAIHSRDSRKNMED